MRRRWSTWNRCWPMRPPLQAEEENSPKALNSAHARATMALIHEGDVQAGLGAFSNARAYYRTAASRGKDAPDDPMLSRVVEVAQQRLAGIADKQVVQGSARARGELRALSEPGRMEHRHTRPGERASRRVPARRAVRLSEASAAKVSRWSTLEPSWQTCGFSAPLREWSSRISRSAQRSRPLRKRPTSARTTPTGTNACSSSG
jgi:hypothetical protein